MPKVQLDLQKFIIISAAVSGIGLFWANLTDKCFKTIYSIVQNQLLYEEEDEEEDVQELKKMIMENIKTTNQWLDETEDEQEGEDVKELKNKLREQIKNINSSVNQLFDKGGDKQELKNKIREQIENIKSLVKELMDKDEREDFQEGEDVQQLLTRLGERKHLED